MDCILPCKTFCELGKLVNNIYIGTKLRVSYIITSGNNIKTLHAT